MIKHSILYILQIVMFRNVTYSKHANLVLLFTWLLYKKSKYFIMTFLAIFLLEFLQLSLKDGNIHEILLYKAEKMQKEREKKKKQKKKQEVKKEKKKIIIIKNRTSEKIKPLFLKASIDFANRSSNKMI